MKLVIQPRTDKELRATLPSRYLCDKILKNNDWHRTLCGQCCVATVAEVSLIDAILATSCVGATRASDLCNGLSNLGVRFSTPLSFDPPFIFGYVSPLTQKAHWMIALEWQSIHDCVKARVLDPYTCEQFRYFDPKTIRKEHINIERMKT